MFGNKGYSAQKRIDFLSDARDGEERSVSHPSRGTARRSNINFVVTSFRYPPISRDPYGNGDRSSESSLRVETSPRGSDGIHPRGGGFTLGGETS